ncbi:MAG TPA: glycosyltransferase [Thermoanaerobaculia bacterium]
MHTPDVVGDRMAGPGIRAWNFARELAKHVDTTLIAGVAPQTEGLTPPNQRSDPDAANQRPDPANRRSDPAAAQRSDPAAAQTEGLTPNAANGRPISPIGPIRPIGPIVSPGAFTILPHNSPDARRALRQADVLIGQPARRFGRKRRDQRVVYDMFDPTVLELRELYGTFPSLRQRVHLAAEWWRLSSAMIDGDLLIAASEKQKELYRALQANDAPWITVPFGIDPADVKACPKPQDNVVVWGGGVWEWLDPATAIEAVLRLNAEGLRCKLLFLGRARPSGVQVVDRRRESRFDRMLAEGGPHVSANNEWVPYSQRLAWLRSGKIAIMLHRPTAEADYSIRTRLFDAIAAAVPVVATERGFAAELVEKEKLGIVVAPGDVEGVARAVRRLLSDDAFYSDCVRNLERIQPRFAWDNVTRPLVDAILKWLN